MKTLIYKLVNGTEKTVSMNGGEVIERDGGIEVIDGKGITYLEVYPSSELEYIGWHPKPHYVKRGGSWWKFPSRSEASIFILTKYRCDLHPREVEL